MAETWVTQRKRTHLKQNTKMVHRSIIAILLSTIVMTCHASFDPTYPFEYVTQKRSRPSMERIETKRQHVSSSLRNDVISPKKVTNDNNNKNNDFSNTEQVVFDVVEHAEKTIRHVVESAVHDEVDTLFQDLERRERRPPAAVTSSSLSSAAFVRGRR